MDGEKDGLVDGDILGLMDGDILGDILGLIDGDKDGLAEGDLDGLAEGDLDGLAEGDILGDILGLIDAELNKDRDGLYNGVELAIFKTPLSEPLEILCDLGMVNILPPNVAAPDDAVMIDALDALDAGANKGTEIVDVSAGNTSINKFLNLDTFSKFPPVIFVKYSCDVIRSATSLTL